MQRVKTEYSPPVLVKLFSEFHTACYSGSLSDASWLTKLVLKQCTGSMLIKHFDMVDCHMISDTVTEPVTYIINKQ